MPAVAKMKPAETAMLKQYESSDDPIHDEPVPAAKTEVAPEPVKHPGWLLRAAKAVKIDDSEIAGMDRKELERAIELSRAHFDDMKRHEQPRPRDDQGRFQKPEPEPEEPFSLRMLGLDPRKWDEFEEVDGVTKPKTSTEGVLTEVVAPLMKQIKELQKQIGEIGQRERSRGEREATNELDRLFATKADLFGKETFADLKPGSPEWKRRAAIARAMDEAARQEPGIGFKENFTRQVEDLYPGKPEPEPIKERPDPHGFQNGTTRPPTARVEAPRAKGRRAAEDMLQERFLGGGPHRAPEEDEEP